jgi:hypothetical protein
VQLSRYNLVGSDIVAERQHFVTCGQPCFTWTELCDELMQLLAAAAAWKWASEENTSRLLPDAEEHLVSALAPFRQLGSARHVL